jgi:lipoprotein-anchoring transpeptidase ErfK/SrfK
LTPFPSADLLRALKIHPSMMRTLFLCLSAAILAAGCAVNDPRFSGETVYIGGYHSPGTAPRRANYDNVSYWDGDGVNGSPAVRISLGEQRAYFYKGGELVGVSAISTGREGFGTNTGSFKIIQKDKDHVSSRFGDYVDRDGNIIKKEIDREKDPMPRGAIYDGARMPYFMRIVGGTGMHEGFLPGYPASHGCIRMPGFMAEKFFDNVSVGTPVSVTH